VTGRALHAYGGQVGVAAAVDGSASADAVAPVDAAGVGGEVVV